MLNRPKRRLFGPRAVVAAEMAPRQGPQARAGRGRQRQLASYSGVLATEALAASEAKVFEEGAAQGSLFRTVEQGLVTFCNSKQWTKQAAARA